jgi:hypothetical protein
MLKSENVKAVHPAVYPHEAGVVYVSDGVFEIAAVENVDESVIALCILPARCVPLDFVVIVDALDSDGTLVWDGGAIKADELEIDASGIMIAASQVGRTGAPGTVRSVLFPIVAPSDSERLFGIHVTALTTGIAGTIRGILTYRSEEYGA